MRAAGTSFSSGAVAMGLRAVSGEGEGSVWDAGVTGDQRPRGLPATGPRSAAGLAAAAEEAPGSCRICSLRHWWSMLAFHRGGAL
eukprot:336832-Prorocentrum_lima.AAC.1